MHRLLPLLLLAACAPRHDPAAVNSRAVEVRQLTLQVTLDVANESRRPLDLPRPDVVDQAARLRGRSIEPFSTEDAFAAAATIELERRGLRVHTDHRTHPRAGLAVFRITLHDIDVRDGGTAGAVAFVSAEYTLTDEAGRSQWKHVDRRLPIRLGGPDLMESQLARIATEAVRRALAPLPASLLVVE